MKTHRVVSLVGLGIAAIAACVGDSTVPTDGGSDATLDGGNDSGTADADAGACPGQTQCGQACVSVDKDPNNCGACNKVCPSLDGGQFACIGGKCGNAIVDVALGVNHACAVLLDGSVWCWGRNGSGELGVPVSTTASATPLKAQIDNVARITIGDGSTTCAVKKDDTVWCWGPNPLGILGHPAGGGSPADTNANGGYFNPVPQQVGGLTPSDEVTVLASFAACARATTGGVWCWGNLSCGVTGQPDAAITSGSLPTAVTNVSGVVHLADPHAGFGQCAIQDAGSLLCWGENSYGETGHAPEPTPPFCEYGIAGSVSAPSVVSGIANVTSVTNGDNGVVCATTSAGALYCWGYTAGYLVLDASAAFPTPLLVSTGTSAKAKKVVSGGAHICALFDDSTIRCWGAGSLGQIGDGTIDSGVYPVTQSSVTNAVDVFAGTAFTAALLSDGSLAIWGVNNYGDLGHTGGTAGDVPCGTGNGSNCADKPVIVSGIP